MLSDWVIVSTLIFCFVTHIHAGTKDLQSPKTPTSPHTLVPSIPAHNDTSHDSNGKDHDTEPLRNNGRGSHEASSQNRAAETNGTHGIPIDIFQQMMLDEHNKCRRTMCAEALQEDDELHAEAMKRAHSVANGQPLPLPDEYNENDVAFDTGDPSNITSTMIVRKWCDKSKQYNEEKEESALEFSQLVWKSSKKLGIGHAYNGHKLYIVALYKPSGNIHGEFRANVGCGSKSEQKPATG